MDLFITSDADWEARLDSVSKSLSCSRYRTFFESKDYGIGLQGIGIILMCRDSGLRFKQRIRFVKKDKQLDLDIMLDLNAFRQMDDDERLRTVVSRLRDEIPAVLGKYSLPDFDSGRFLADLDRWLDALWLWNLGTRTTLIEAVRDLDFLDEKSTIYAAEPWSEDSQVLVAREPDAGSLPADAQKLGLKYFLEVFIAHEFLERWVTDLAREPTLQEKCSRLIQYAITDA